MPDVHAKFSPSASDRLIHCPPSLVLGEQYGPEDTGSEYSREGTEAHSLGEYLLKQALGLPCEDPRPSLKMYSSEMQECAEGYRDAVLEIYETMKQTCPDAIISVEQQVSFEEYVAGGFGTSDCVILALSREECVRAYTLAKENSCILYEGIKTAYSTAYERLVLLAKSGKIGDILSIDVTCTSLKYLGDEIENNWNSICAWGPTAMLTVFQILGVNYLSKKIISHVIDEKQLFDGFTKVDFIYPKAVASIKVAKGAKSEGELVVTGTKGYIYVPAPWWKTDYFEVRFENPTENKRYFYQLDGEGIRYEIVAFARSVESGRENFYVSKEVSETICGIIEDYYKRVDVTYI